MGELAHHWFHATQLVDTQKAVSYSRQAGEAALAALAPADAVRYFLQALQLLDQLPAGADPALAVDLRLDLGIAQRQAGLPAFRETFLEAAHRAQALGDPDRLVQAALANNRGFFSALGVVDDEKVAVLESALGWRRPGDSPERAVLLATLCSELAYGSLDRRLELAREATEMAERLDDPATADRRAQPAAAAAQHPEHPARTVARQRQGGGPGAGARRAGAAVLGACTSTATTPSSRRLRAGHAPSRGDEGARASASASR